MQPKYLAWPLLISSTWLSTSLAIPQYGGLGIYSSQNDTFSRTQSPIALMSIKGPVDLIRESAADLQERLTAGSLTSVELVRLCLHQIHKYDRQGPNLHAMISVAPEAKLLERAQFLDDERQANRLLGSLHGIPIIIKDIWDTHPSTGMPTTHGAWVLAQTFGKDDSLLVKKLQEAGLIVIGKANLSEFGWVKGSAGPVGFSNLGGQGQSAYVKGGLNPADEPLGISNPGGSSVGSAVGVAAGYSPLSIGGEVDGSIQTPGSRSALYSLKCTPRTISTEGMLSLAPTFESPGGMAKTAQDLIDLVSVILLAAKTPRTIEVSSDKQWIDFRIGFLDYTKWRLPSSLFISTEDYCRQVDSAYAEAISKMKSLGATVHYPVPVPHPSTIVFDGDYSVRGIISAEMRDSINSYLRNTSTSGVHSLAEIIQYNKDHPELQAGIGQEGLIAAQENTRDEKWIKEGTEHIQKVAGHEGILKIMHDLDLDFVVSATDGPISSISAMAGCPTGNVPLGYLEPSGRPFGLTFVARPGGEEKLLEVMRLYESSFPKRRLPQVLLDWEKS